MIASDEWDAFKEALLEVYSREEAIPGLALQAKGKTHRVLPADLGYVQVRKIRQGQQVIRIERHIVFGHPLDVRNRLQSSGNGNIHTSYIERFNGTMRNSLTHFIRKTVTFSKQMVMHVASLDFFRLGIISSNLITRCGNLALNARKNGSNQTPAMAEGLTDYVWTLEELVTFRVAVH